MAKILTARALQKKIGGDIIFFYHDSDHDFRETITIMRDRQTNIIDRINFEQENKIQKKYSPLYCKRIPAPWQQATARRLRRFVDQPLIDYFTSVQAATVADFCLALYQKMGLLDTITIVRSSDPGVRETADELTDDYFADLPYENEIVRARVQQGRIFLHRGGGQYLDLPAQPIAKKQKNPNREQRFGWMQSVIGCSHYITGRGEGKYLNPKAFPNITFVERDDIADSDLAWTNL